MLGLVSCEKEIPNRYSIEIASNSEENYSFDVSIKLGENETVYYTEVGSGWTYRWTNYGELNNSLCIVRTDNVNSFCDVRIVKNNTIIQEYYIQPMDTVCVSAIF